MKLMLLGSESRQHQFWVHDILKRRHEYGAYYHLVKELELDNDKYHAYFRMSGESLQRYASDINLAREFHDSADVIPRTWKYSFSLVKTRGESRPDVVHTNTGVNSVQAEFLMT